MSLQMPAYIEPDFTQEKFQKSPNCQLAACPKDKAAPDNFHATSIFPEYFKVNGEWLLAEESRMDCLPVYENGKIAVKEFRNVKQGDMVVLGRSENCEEGIYVHSRCFQEPQAQENSDFAFRQGRSRETGFTCDYDALVELLEHEKEHGHILWVLGPACAFDRGARTAFSKLIMNGYCHGLMAGNALATHDLEAAWMGTALGSDIYTQRPHFNGHYNHITTINKINQYGSIEKFIEAEGIDNGIIYSCQKMGIPVVLNGSIRDDGPLPEVLEHTYIGQDTMRAQVRKATTVISMATTLHTIATGNMTPSFRVLEDGTKRPIYFYMVDTAEFAVNKLSDRGSLSARGIVTNVQDFVGNLARGLNL